MLGERERDEKEDGFLSHGKTDILESKESGRGKGRQRKEEEGRKGVGVRLLIEKGGRRKRFLT